MMALAEDDEVPTSESMLASLMPAKLILANLMTNKLGKLILPCDLNSICLEVVSFAGYFKIGVIHGNNLKAQAYNISIKGNNGNVLATKISSSIRKRYPKICGEEVVERANNIIINL